MADRDGCAVRSRIGPGLRATDFAGDFSSAGKVTDTGKRHAFLLLSCLAVRSVSDTRARASSWIRLFFQPSFHRLQQFHDRLLSATIWGHRRLLLYRSCHATSVRFCRSFGAAYERARPGGDCAVNLFQGKFLVILVLTTL